MKFSKRLKHLLTISTLTSLYGISLSATAALNLPDAPLFISTSPQANIMFAVDDSGSMDWEVLKSDGALAAHPTSPNSGNLDLSPNDHNEDREFCPGYNVLAYDPNVTYTPWIGEDDAGVPFGDQSPTAARVDPYKASGSTQNLLSPCCSKSMIYGIWADDGDGVYQSGECPIAPQASGGFSSRTHTGAGFVSVATLSAAEQTNFANWYSYYRKREYVLKRAMSELIDQSTARLGLATLHNNNSIGTPVEDMTDTAKKEALEDEMFRINSSSNTPLRALLNNVGKYFDDTDGSGAPSALGFTNQSPIQTASEGGDCQQNYAVLMSDGFWNGSLSGVGNEDADGTGNDTTFDGGPHADTLSNTLADVAMKYYEKDLSSLDDNVPVIENLDDNTSQHMVTYSVAFGLSGTGLTTPPDHDATTPAPPWSDPINNSGAQRLDDMQHAAFNSRGIFLNAKDPQTLIDSFTSAFVDIGQRTSFSGTAVAISSTVLRTSSRLFTAQFDSTDYSGELSAFTLNDDATLDQEVWTASNNIPSFGSRNIYTIVDKAGVPTAIDFDSTDTDLVTAVGSTLFIDYIAGDQSNEIQNGGIFRDRSVLLADIVKSSPVSAGGNDFFLDILPGTEGSSYLSYINSKISAFTDASNDPFSVVYVGANGGMLHAVDSRDGSELFSYVPKAVHSNLNLLTDPNYGHKFFVNSTGTANDVYINTGSGNSWHTIYTSGLGEGGRAIFTLDISDPLNTGNNPALWEKSNVDYPELGFVLQRPRIARMNNGEWAVIVANGYNSDSEKAQLLILNAEDGSLIKQIDTNTGGTGAISTGISNGLAEPFLLDENGDRIVDFIYAADLLGNMWKFDVSDPSASNWKIAFGTTASPIPLFTAKDDKNTSNTADDTVQNITVRPIMVRHPDGGFMVLFGTGKYLEPSDKVVPSTPDVNTFYGIRDNGAPVAFSDLVQQTILDEFDVTDPLDPTIVLNRVRVVSENTVDYSTKDGWYIDLVTPPSTKKGEMVIANPLTRFGRAIFTTFIPGDSPCDLGGDSVLMEVDAVSGARLQNSVFDLNGDGVIDASDFVNYNGSDIPGSGIFIPASTSATNVVSGTTDEFKLSVGTDTTVTSVRESDDDQMTGRQAWIQLQ